MSIAIVVGLGCWAAFVFSLAWEERHREDESPEVQSFKERLNKRGNREQ